MTLKTLSSLLRQPSGPPGGWRVLATTLGLALALALPLAGEGPALERRIRCAGPGLQRLQADPHLLARCAPGLSDLRLKDASGRDLPYLVVPGDPREARSLPAPSLRLLGSEPGQARYALALPAPLPLKAVLMDPGEGGHGREYVLTEGRLLGGQLAQHLLGRATAADGERALRLPAEPVQGLDLVLKVRGARAPHEPREETPEAPRLLGLELEALPWICFQSPEGAPVTALYGDGAQVNAPGAPPALAGAPAEALPQAVWETPGETPEEEHGALTPGAMLPRLPPTAFRRTLPEASPGPAALLLDARTLALAEAPERLRLMDAQGREIPYLLEERDESLGARLDFAPMGPGRWRASLPGPALPAGRLVLEGAGGTRRRQVRILQDQGNGSPRLLLEDSWTGAAPRVLPLPPLEGPELLVEVDGGSLDALTLLLPRRRLRFLHPGGRVELVQLPSGELPRYDLHLLLARLRGEGIRELRLDAPARPGRARWLALGLLGLGILSGGGVAAYLWRTKRRQRRAG